RIYFFEALAIALFMVARNVGYSTTNSFSPFLFTSSTYAYNHRSRMQALPTQYECQAIQSTRVLLFGPVECARGKH
ncbi:hypothetical protein BJ742DRAFT_827830, partial [Cladochytrium replicatum]